MLVFLNGQIIKEEEAKISINDLSYQFGYGLFETIRCENGIPLFFEEHYKRLITGSKEIGMPFPVDIDEINTWIKDVLNANKLSSARIKILISKRVESSGEKFNVLILPGELGVLPDSYSILGKNISRDSKSFSFIHKTTSRADSYIAYKEATERGFNDVLFINEKNELIECSRANIFLVLEEKIITPELATGILSGVTRKIILDICKKNNIIIEEKKVNSLFFNKTKDVFISNAIIGIMPVSRLKLENKEYRFSPSILTQRLKALYSDYIRDFIKCSL